MTLIGFEAVDITGARYQIDISVYTCVQWASATVFESIATDQSLLEES